MENFYKAISDASNVVVVLPTKPTFDQVAAALAIQLSLSKSKGASVYCPIDMTVEFNRLIGVDKISKDLGNKNLVIKLKDYPGEGVERVSADIENGEFYLTIIPKPGNIAPNKDQLEFSYSGLSSDTVILIGGANESHFPIMAKPEMKDTKYVHIGVRELQNSRNIMSVGRPASSDSEIAASVILDHNYQSRQQGQPTTQTVDENALFLLNADVATNLLMGVDEASGGFTRESNADTFMIVSQLMRAGGTRQVKQEVNPGSYPQGSIPMHSASPVSPVVQSQPVNNVPEQTATSQVPSHEETFDNPPDEWNKPPKVYKGTDQN